MGLQHSIYRHGLFVSPWSENAKRTRGVAVCCSVLQCVAVVLQCVAVCCSVLQCAAVCCSILQCVDVQYVAVRRPGDKMQRELALLQCVAVCYSVLQCIAVCCCVLPCAAVCCSVLQCVAVYCNALQCVAMCCSVSLWRKDTKRTSVQHTLQQKLQHTHAMHCSLPQHTCSGGSSLTHDRSRCNTHRNTHCNKHCNTHCDANTQCAVTHCNTLQHTATHLQGVAVV